MLAKIMSAVALTLLLTGGALAYIPQPHNINSVEPQQTLQTELFAANTELSEPQPHNIYAGHNNSVEPQQTLQTELFAANTELSEPRQFD
jgi:hypothetical protein